jgi:hypothetical protein
MEGRITAQPIIPGVQKGARKSKAQSQREDRHSVLLRFFKLSILPSDMLYFRFGPILGCAHDG